MCAKSSSVNKKILIRADGSQQIGFGHISRCLALAEALTSQGMEAAFAIKSTSDQVADVIARQGHAVHQLAKDSSEPKSLFELAQHQEARVVCVDTYEADVAYLRALKDFGLNVVFVDDFARFPIPVDMVVNYNAYAPDLTYQVDSATRLLLGPRYSLLQQRFKKARDHHTIKAPENVLVMFGGADLHNWSGKIASALLQSLPEAAHITIITGPASATRHELEALSKTTSRLEVKLQPKDLPAIMAKASLAISGAGVTAYELACLGVPSLLLVLADNQFRNAEAFDRLGIATSLGWHENLRPEKIAVAVVAHLADKKKLARMSARGRQLVDGMGAERVAKEILHEIDSRV